MDQKDHIATLCALGTVGAAAAGLVFAADHGDDHSQVDSHLLRPGKRKWSGATGHRWPLPTTAPALPRRSVSQPVTPILYSESSTCSLQPPPSNRLSSAPQIAASSRQATPEDVPSSRASSKIRWSLLRPQTPASWATTDKRESGSSTGWIKRLSSLSSQSTSPAPSLNYEDNHVLGRQTISIQRPSTSGTSIPNKLVKRSVSQRGVSHDEARGQILRRPATSHRRSQTFRDILARPTTSHDDVGHQGETSVFGPSMLPSTPEKRSWQPFFESRFPRKRRKSEVAAEPNQIRIISLPTCSNPVMLLATEHPAAESPAGIDGHTQLSPPITSDVVVSNHRPRRSLSSLRKFSSPRRNFTDPSVQLTRADANGTISPVKVQNAMTSSVMSVGSSFDVSLPPGTPQFMSSPPLSNYERRPSLLPRQSFSASDPPTTSSDADGRVFSDAESMDFQSDTAYDSIATRATTASFVGAQDSKLETIFAARTSDETEARSEMWQNLSHREMDQFEAEGTQAGMDDVDMQDGIGITMPSLPGSTQTSVTTADDDVMLATPPRSPSFEAEDFTVTPVPLRNQTTKIDSSPPLLPTSKDMREYDQVGEMLDDMRLDDEEIDWASREHSILDDADCVTQHHIMSFAGIAPRSFVSQFKENEESHDLPIILSQRSSIFDWSENKYITNSSRPKTVHGKQGHSDRSRTSGRKGPPQLHFRSQSVPVNRDGPIEELPPTSKYQTWRLGHKPVSEEWSDDFEFEDVEEIRVESPAVDVHTQQNLRDSVRSVRIPQSIMDRQPSVHLQFGQVQEFMALVEELKRLRARAMELQLLSGHARQLWDDAESIINLATINDEDDVILTQSPPSSDPFKDISNLPIPIVHSVPATRPRRPTNTGRRSVSTMTTPPIHGRARGESLAQARYLLEAMHSNRDGIGSSPREIEIHQQKKLPFDTQDLKDLVVRSGVIVRALKQEVRKAEGVTVSPQKPSSGRDVDEKDHPLNELFRTPEPQEASSPCPPLRKPGLPKSRSANSYLESSGPRQQSGPFSSPIALTAVVW